MARGGDRAGFMKAFRELLLSILPITGFVLFIGAHVLGDITPVALAVSAASLLCFLATLVIALIPERRPGSRPRPSREPPPPPRVLPRDVLNNPGFPMSLPQRIEAAIELSRVEARTLGILSIRIEATAEDAVIRASDALRKTLRATDRAIVQEAGEILVCLPLIAIRSDLDAVAGRLSRVAAKSLGRPAGGGIDVGIAMYPIDGLRAEELIEAAQAHAEALRNRRHGRRPALRAGTRPPLLPPAKTARRTAA